MKQLQFYLAVLLCSTLGFFCTKQGYAQNLPAFPGAEGHGMYTTGGRGGCVIKVTNLNDSGEGSLRAAVEASGSRIVVFEVSGTIALESKLFIRKDSITIAGQTAPGDGICIKNYCVYITASNVIIRYMRFRMGDEAMQEDDAVGGQGSRNMIIDHCSMSWSTDECASFYANENFTMQWCLIGESLVNSVHEKGEHGYGGIWGGNKASFHHNLLANHSNRNPRLRGHKLNSPTDAELVDLRNNVIYNYKGTCYGSEGGGNYNLVNNYYKFGPATGNNIDKVLKVYVTEAEYNWLELEGAHGVFYVEGNYVHGNTDVTRNNWKGVEIKPLITPEKAKSELEFDKGNITTDDAETAYQKVLAYVGASLFRDAVDKRTIHDAMTGTATIMDGGNGSTNGFIDTQDAAGGWPLLNSLPAPLDTDGDGMPDEWEVAHGLNPNNRADSNGDRNNDGYTNIEEYINSLALNHVDTSPLINLVKPRRNEAFVTDGNVNIDIEAWSNDYNGGQVVNMQLYFNDELIVEDTSSNKIITTREKVSPGIHQISVHSTDNSGNITIEKTNVYVGKKEVLVNIEESPNGKVILEPSGGNYTEGVTVKAAAIPEEGYIFNSWGKGFETANSSLQITTSKDITLKPVFIKDPEIKSIYSRPIKINFQPEDDFAVPDGYLPDIGGKYCKKVSGYSYGWIEGYNGSNGINPQKSYMWETFRNFGHDNEVFSWEIELPKGIYKVKLGLGADRRGVGTDRFKINVEGISVENSDQADSRKEHILKKVLVKDGQLTLTGVGESRIYFIEIELKKIKR